MILVYVMMIVPPLLLAWGLLATFVPYFKQDAAWERYNTAYYEWESNGHIGDMPKSEDYGYITKEENA